MYHLFIFPNYQQYIEISTNIGNSNGRYNVQRIDQIHQSSYWSQKQINVVKYEFKQYALSYLHSCDIVVYIVFIFAMEKLFVQLGASLVFVGYFQYLYLRWTEHLKRRVDMKHHLVLEICQGLVWKDKSSSLMSKTNKTNQTYYKSYQLTEKFMLSERKRFNYINTRGDQNVEFKRQKDSRTQETIQNLQRINRKIVEDTAKQFQQFERDIERVENILKSKQDYIYQLKSQNSDLNIDLEVLTDQLSRKDQQIRFLQQQIQSLVQESHSKSNIVQILKNQAHTISRSLFDQSVQTQYIIEQKSKKQELYKAKYDQINDRAIQMEEQIYKLKEQLYNTTSELSLLRQQFASYKILKQIESVQKQ